MPAETSFPNEEIEILLLEGVPQQGIGPLREEAFAVETEKRAFSEADLEAAGKLTRFIHGGSTEEAVDFPNVVLPELSGHHRILNIHENVPGVLQKVNAIFGEAGSTSLLNICVRTRTSAT